MHSAIRHPPGVPIPTPALTSSDLEPNFKVMASAAVRKVVMLSQTLQAYYARLLEKLSPQGRWPARTRLEMVVGAVLTQNTSWLDVAQAMKRLRQARRLACPVWAEPASQNWSL